MNGFLRKSAPFIAVALLVALIALLRLFQKTDPPTRVPPSNTLQRSPEMAQPVLDATARVAATLAADTSESANPTLTDAKLEQPDMDHETQPPIPPRRLSKADCDALLHQAWKLAIPGSGSVPKWDEPLAAFDTASARLYLRSVRRTEELATYEVQSCDVALELAVTTASRLHFEGLTHVTILPTSTGATFTFSVPKGELGLEAVASSTPFVSLTAQMQLPASPTKQPRKYCEDRLWGQWRGGGSSTTTYDFETGKVNVTNFGGTTSVEKDVKLVSCFKEFAVVFQAEGPERPIVFIDNKHAVSAWPNEDTSFILESNQLEFLQSRLAELDRLDAALPIVPDLPEKPRFAKPEYAGVFHFSGTFVARYDGGPFAQDGVVLKRGSNYFVISGAVPLAWALDPQGYVLDTGKSDTLALGRNGREAKLYTVSDIETYRDDQAAYAEQLKDARAEYETVLAAYPRHVKERNMALKTLEEGAAKNQLERTKLLKLRATLEGPSPSSAAPTHSTP